MEDCRLRPSCKKSIKEAQDTREKLGKDMDIEQLNCNVTLPIFHGIWKKKIYKERGHEAYVKQAFFQSSLFCSALKRSTTFTPSSLHSFTQASE